MKRQEAALSPRCRAVFNEPDAGAPKAAPARSQSKVAETRKRREECQASLSEERERVATLPRHRRQTTRDEDYEETSRPSRGEAFDEQDVGPAAADDGGPEIRHFAPGDGPDEAGAAPAGPPYGNDRYDGGPRYLGPRAWDGPRFADRGPSVDDGPPRFRRDDYGAGVDDSPPAGSRRQARAVIARLCAVGQIDPRTCALTEQALRRERRD